MENPFNKLTPLQREAVDRAMRAPKMPLIVSRHPAAVAFIREELPEFRDAEVLEAVTQSDVFDRVVAGNLPLHLAACCELVIAVEFSGAPPRGAEYGIEEMRAAGARLRRYRVESLDDIED